jgi:hypothetical protein
MYEKQNEFQQLKGTIISLIENEVEKNKLGMA